MKILNDGTVRVKFHLAGQAYSVAPDAIATVPDTALAEFYAKVSPVFPALVLQDILSTDDTAQSELEDSITALQTPNAGTTANRPDEDVPAGFMYFDTTLGLPIWYTGSAWVDATGSDPDL